MKDEEKPKYEMIHHGPWTHVKAVGKSVCEKCGLVWLNNHITEWSVKKGCDATNHPDFKRQLRLSIQLADAKRK